VYWLAGYLAVSGSPNPPTIGDIVAFTTLQSRLFMPLGQLLSVQVEVYGALALFDRIFEYLDTAVDIEEGTVDSARAGDVDFDHVWFRYSEEAWTLEDASFVVPAGTTTALVGETGAGKTTLGYLAARLYDVDRGFVSIGGVDVRDLSFAALARLVGVVSQETYLFHASVRENLRFAKPDATDEEVEAAAASVGVDRVAARLSGGLEHEVREGGAGLSAGERQLISIARALLADPRILVLDEATSNIDRPTEVLIEQALDRLLKGRTSIIIAHRLSTVRRADEILVVENGQVIQRGSERELLQVDGPFRRLAQTLEGGEPELAVAG
jgi:ATP-binding cassette subfamily B protein